jgi:cobalamin biosynthesis protein CbiG
VADDRRYAVGVGLASAAGPDELAALVDEVLRAAGVEPDQVRAVGTVDLRAGHPALAALGWPVVAYPPAALAGAAPAVTPRSRPPVAEPAALLAAGPGARLVVPKRRSAQATAALAVAVDVAVEVRA